MPLRLMRLFFFSALISKIVCAISLGDPRYVGTGCKNGTLTAVLSPDKRVITILFDNYFVAAGGSVRRVQERKHCNIRIPIHVEAKKSISLFQVDYRGFNSIPPDGLASFQADYFFNGRLSPPLKKRFYNTREEFYFIRHRLSSSERTWSRCGQNIELAAHTQAYVKTNRERDDVYQAIDTIDIEAGLSYHIRMRDCHSAHPHK